MDISDHSLEPDDMPKSKPRYSSAFFAGPISLDWLQKACRLGGKSLAMGVALVHEAKLKKCTEVRMNGKLLAGFGVTRHSGNRALKKLEAAGLIEFTISSPGKCKIVRLIGHLPDSRSISKNCVP